MTDERFTVAVHEDHHEREWRYTVTDSVSGLACDYAVEKRIARWITRDAPVSGWNVDRDAFDRPARKWARAEALKHGTRIIMGTIEKRYSLHA